VAVFCRLPQYLAQKGSAKIQFLKLDALGSDKKYKWTAYQGIMDAKDEITLTKINSGVKN